MTSELLFFQRKEGEEPKEEQEALTELLDSTSSLADTDTSTFDTGTVDVKKRCTVQGETAGADWHRIVEPMTTTLRHVETSRKLHVLISHSYQG